MNLDDDQNFDKITIKREKKSGIIEKLKQMGLLEYGKYIHIDHIEQVMGLIKNRSSEIDWAFAELNLREIIKEQGYFITSRGQAGKLYILTEKEMPEENARKMKIMYSGLKQRQRALNMIDPNNFKDEFRKKLEFEVMKNADVCLKLANKVNSRCKY